MSISLKTLAVVAAAALTYTAQAQDRQVTEPTALYAIKDVGAASGLIHKNGQLYIISDNSNYLYRYTIGQQELQRILVLDRGINEDVPKKYKADFEAVTDIDGTLYLFGSGSSRNRKALVKYSPDAQKVEKQSLHRLYRRLQRRFDVGQDDFNIEGALTIGDELWLFNRGNGPGAKNGIFILNKADFKPKAFHPIPMSQLNGVALGFSDAILIDSKVYFIAAAEGEGSTYHDGEIQGTVLGCLDPTNMKMDFIETISTSQKFEGLALEKKADKQIDFLLCEDPDDGGSSSTIYQLRLSL